MGVLITPQNAKNNATWKRMLYAFDMVSKEHMVNATFKFGKGWQVHNIDQERISDCLTKNKIPHELKGLYTIIIL